MRLRAALGAALMLPVLGCGRPQPAIPSAHLPDPQQLLPPDLNVLVRADWQRARELGLSADMLAYAQALGMPSTLWDASQACLQAARTLVLALRLGRDGVDGDGVLLLSGLGTEPLDPNATGAPCALRGWHAAGTQRGVLRYEPTQVPLDRSAPALALVVGDTLVLASNAEVDPVIRQLRATAQPIESPSGTSGALVQMHARLGADSLPAGLRGRAPALSELAIGLTDLRVSYQASGELRAVLAYGTAQQAQVAGAKLRDTREALVSGAKGAVRQAAVSAHASVLEELVTLRLQLDRGPRTAR